jgi:hypothetical protein
MAGRTDALRERYERFSRGDLAGALDLWTDDFVWEGDESDLPGSGRHQSGRLPVVHIWRYCGEQICRLQLLTDTLGMARLLGLA